MDTIYNRELHLSKLKKMLYKLIEYVEQASNNTEIHHAEREIFSHVKQMGFVALQLFIANCGPDYNAGQAPTSESGKPLRYKGIFFACYLSIFGEIKIPRAGYHDTSQGQYYYPLDAQLNLPEDKYSYLLTDWILQRATETDYRESVALFNEIFDLKLSQVMPQRHCEKMSQAVDPFYEQAEAPPPETEGSYLAVTADGKGVRIHKSEREGENYKTNTPKARRSKGEKPGIKKEATVAAVYSFDPGPRTAEDVAKTLLKEYTPEEVKQIRAEKRKAKQEQLPLPRFALNKYQRSRSIGKR